MVCEGPAPNSEGDLSERAKALLKRFPAIERTSPAFLAELDRLDPDELDSLMSYLFGRTWESLLV
jgi:hypothetical protein